MKLRLNWLLTLISVMAFSPAAYAGPLTAYVIGNWHSASPSPEATGTSYGRKMGLGFGALLDLADAGPLAIQFGALYLGNSTTVQGPTASDVGTYSGKQLQIPLQARFELGDLIAASLGVYYGMNLGQLSCTASGSVACVRTDDIYSAFGRKTSDFGFSASVGTLFSLGASALTLDLRYTHGFTNQVENSVVAGVTDIKQTDIQVLAGLRLPL